MSHVLTRSAAKRNYGQLYRLLRLTELLRVRPEGLSRNQVTEAIGCNDHTTYRDLMFLCSCGVAERRRIDGDDGRSPRYFYRGPIFRGAGEVTLPKNFSQSERKAYKWLCERGYVGWRVDLETKEVFEASVASDSIHARRHESLVEFARTKRPH